MAALLSVRRRLFFLAGAEIAHDPEIMVGELEIIFGLDPVARKLRVAREVAVFLDHLGRVAARAAVDAVALIDVAILPALRALVVATATAAALTIVYGH